jgi:hypothetical protein
MFNSALIVKFQIYLLIMNTIIIACIINKYRIKQNQLGNRSTGICNVNLLNALNIQFKHLCHIIQGVEAVKLPIFNFCTTSAGQIAEWFVIVDLSSYLR